MSPNKISHINRIKQESLNTRLTSLDKLKQRLGDTTTSETGKKSVNVKMKTVIEELESDLLKQIDLENISDAHTLMRKIDFAIAEYVQGSRAIILDYILNSPEDIEAAFLESSHMLSEELLEKLTSKGYVAHTKEKLEQRILTVLSKELVAIIYRLARVSNKRLILKRRLGLEGKFIVNMIQELFASASIVPLELYPDSQRIGVEAQGFYSNPLMLFAYKLHANPFNVKLLSLFSKACNICLNPELNSVQRTRAFEKLIQEEQFIVRTYFPERLDKGASIYGINPNYANREKYLAHELIHLILDYIDREKNPNVQKNITQNEFVVDYLANLIYIYCFPEKHQSSVGNELDLFVAQAKKTNPKFSFESRAPLLTESFFQAGIDPEKISSGETYDLAEAEAARAYFHHRSDFRRFILEEIQKVGKLL